MARASLCNKPGRPFEISTHEIEKIVEAYKQTIVLSNIAGLVRRHKHTILGWLDQGEIDFLAQEDTLFAQLFTSVKFELAKQIVRLEQMLLNNETGWQRFAWMLERTVRRDYSVYGEIFEDIQSQLNALIEKATGLDQPQAQEISAELRGWLKDKLLEGKIAADAHEQKNRT